MHIGAMRGDFTRRTRWLVFPPIEVKRLACEIVKCFNTPESDITPTQAQDRPAIDPPRDLSYTTLWKVLASISNSALALMVYASFATSDHVPNSLDAVQLIPALPRYAQRALRTLMPLVPGTKTNSATIIQRRDMHFSN